MRFPWNTVNIHSESYHLRASSFNSARACQSLTSCTRFTQTLHTLVTFLWCYKLVEYIPLTMDVFVFLIGNMKIYVGTVNKTFVMLTAYLPQPLSSRDVLVDIVRIYSASSTYVTFSQLLYSNWFFNVISIIWMIIVQWR